MLQGANRRICGATWVQAGAFRKGEEHGVAKTRVGDLKKTKEKIVKSEKERQDSQRKG